MRALALALVLPLVGAVPHGRHHDLKRWTPLPASGEANNIPPPHIVKEVTEGVDEHGNQVTTTKTTTTTYRLSTPDDVEAGAASPAPVDRPQPAAMMQRPEAKDAQLPDARPSSAPSPSVSAPSEDQGADAESEAPAGQSSTGNASSGGSSRKEWVQEMLKQLSGQKLDKESRNKLYLSLINQFREQFKDQRGELELSTDATVLAESLAGNTTYGHGLTDLGQGNSMGQNIAYYPTPDVAGADPELAAMLNCVHGWFHEEESLWDYQSKQMRADAAQIWAAAGYSGDPTVLHFKNILDARYGSGGFAVQRHAELKTQQGLVDAYFCVANFVLGPNAVGGEENLPAKKPERAFPQPKTLVKAFLSTSSKGGNSAN